MNGLSINQKAHLRAHRAQDTYRTLTTFTIRPRLAGEREVESRSPQSDSLVNLLSVTT